MLTHIGRRSDHGYHDYQEVRGRAEGVRHEVEITRVREDKPILTLRTICYNQRGEMVVDGEAMVLAPSR